MKKSPREPKVFSLFWNPEEAASKTSDRMPQKNIYELDKESKPVTEYLRRAYMNLTMRANGKKEKLLFHCPFICGLPPKGKVQI